MMIIFSVTPFGVGEHLSEQVARAVKIVAESGLPYQVTPMGTIIEGEWDAVMAVVNQCRLAILEECPRVAIKCWIDDKQGVTDSMSYKTQVLQERLGMPLKVTPG